MRRGTTTAQQLAVVMVLAALSCTSCSLWFASRVEYETPQDVRAAISTEEAIKILEDLMDTAHGKQRRSGPFVDKEGYGYTYSKGVLGSSRHQVRFADMGEIHLEYIPTVIDTPPGYRVIVYDKASSELDYFMWMTDESTTIEELKARAEQMIDCFTVLRDRAQ